MVVSVGDPTTDGGCDLDGYPMRAAPGIDWTAVVLDARSGLNPSFTWPLGQLNQGRGALNAVSGQSDSPQNTVTWAHLSNTSIPGTIRHATDIARITDLETEVRALKALLAAQDTQIERANELLDRAAVSKSDEALHRALGFGPQQIGLRT